MFHILHEQPLGFIKRSEVTSLNKANCRRCGVVIFVREVKGGGGGNRNQLLWLNYESSLPVAVG
jgi:hypothetical protein